AKCPVAVVAEGCTAWAARPDWTENGQPILAKNRDQSMNLLGLQCVVRARPTNGYPYIAVTTVGWPGLASSGINAAGLAVADTHVRSTDLGPGLPRWWLMMHILERCETVGEALDYLSSAPRLGNGNVVLADARGDIAVFEEGHSAFGIRMPEGDQGYLVATNHFVTASLRDKCRLEDLGRKGDTVARKARMEAALAEAKGQVSGSWARAMMSSVDGIGAICWEDREKKVGTISTAILSPARRTMWVRHGRLWHGRFRRFGLT
ncbi:MAG: C45 family autoproteolytic acyltransferase/hydrolase, partial [Anaerolineae bacterium]